MSFQQNTECRLQRKFRRERWKTSQKFEISNKSSSNFNQTKRIINFPQKFSNSAELSFDAKYLRQNDSLENWVWNEVKHILTVRHFGGKETKTIPDAFQWNWCEKRQKWFVLPPHNYLAPSTAPACRFSAWFFSRVPFRNDRRKAGVGGGNKHHEK